jgi:energy-coupling factor transport system ATP-binding protein
MENLGVDPTHMRRRVEEMLDLLDLAALRDRSVRTLSGGERQRVAIGAAMAAGPRILVLDEPTSQLDPQGAEHVMSALRAFHDHGHDRVVGGDVSNDRRPSISPSASSEARSPGGGRGSPAAMGPPVAGGGSSAGTPCLTVREARRLGGPRVRAAGDGTTGPTPHLPKRPRASGWSQAHHGESIALCEIDRGESR